MLLANLLKQAASARTPVFFLPFHQISFVIHGTEGAVFGRYSLILTTPDREWDRTDWARLQFEDEAAQIRFQLLVRVSMATL